MQLLPHYGKSLPPASIVAPTPNGDFWQNPFYGEQPDSLSPRAPGGDPRFPLTSLRSIPNYDLPRTPRGLKIRQREQGIRREPVYAYRFQSMQV
jgi:hypothetical protein